MNRRNALAVAGAVVAVSATTTLAAATNLGLLGFGRGPDTSLGSLRAKQPIELATEVAQTTPAGPPATIVQYEDVYLPASSTTTSVMPTTTSTTPTTAPASTVGTSTTIARPIADDVVHDDDGAFASDHDEDDD